MGILDRVGTLIRANLNDILDRAEDPEKVLKQLLLDMNGELVKDRSEAGNISTAATRIAWLAPTDAQAIETAYLAVLTRRPTPTEAEHFATRLRDTRGNRRGQELEDLFWELINSTEFSWNH